MLVQFFKCIEPNWSYTCTFRQCYRDTIDTSPHCNCRQRTWNPYTYKISLVQYIWKIVQAYCWCAKKSINCKKWDKCKLVFMTDLQVHWQRLKENIISSNALPNERQEKMANEFCPLKIPTSAPLVLALISPAKFFSLISNLKMTCLPIYGWGSPSTPTMNSHWTSFLCLAPLFSVWINQNSVSWRAFVLPLVWVEHDTCDHTFLVSDRFLNSIN